jgi:putative cell wall-binding protein
VLGGTGAVDDEVLVALEDRWDVRRVSGPERTATAAAVAELVRARSGAKTVMVARAGPDDAAPWADALAGGAYGAKAGVPVLLTYPTTLTQATRSALRGVERTYVLGGESAVSDAVMAQMPNPQRIAGPDRTGTAVAIAEQLWGRTSGSSKDVVIIGGGFQTTAWTLALAASPLAARVDAPLLLTSGTALSPPTRTHLQSRGYKGDRTASGFVLGGTGAIEDRVLVELSALLQ